MEHDDFGLLCDGKPVPLAGVEVEADLNPAGACTRVTQTYVNRESEPIEATYVFPLDDQAALLGFEARLGDRTIRSAVEERGAARDAYERALDRGDAGLLVHSERPNVFVARVGNLAPGETAVVSLECVAPLAREGGDLRFTLPGCVAPRYAPTGEGTGRPRRRDLLEPPRVLAAPYGLRVAIRVGFETSRIASPSHPIAVSESEGATVVTLGAEVEALDRDFVLVATPREISRSSAVAEVGEDGRTTVAVTFVPPEAGSRRPQDVVFLVDCSGSMQGDSIDQARRALLICLRSLGEGDRFDIVRFGSAFDALFGGPRPYAEATFREAERFVRGLNADLGGTEILPALEAAIGKDEDAPLRSVVVLTDGEVANEDEVFDLARRNRARARIFAIGIGAGPNSHLVRGLASAGRGACEHIFPGERIEPKVLRQFAAIGSPVLENARLEHTGLEAEIAPAEIPPVFPGQALRVFLRVASGNASSVTLVADSPSGPVRLEAPLDLSGARRGNLLAALWARKRLDDLETAVASAKDGRSQATARRRLVRHAMRFHFVSSATSLIAVERRRRRPKERRRPAERHVPVALTAGWHGIGSVRPGISPSLFQPCASPMLCCAPDASFGPAVAMSPGRHDAAGSPDAPPHLDILLAQGPDGAFEPDATLAAMAKLPADWFDRAAASLGGADGRRAAATLLALWLLDRLAPAHEIEWRRHADKALAWLDGHGYGRERDEVAALRREIEALVPAMAARRSPRRRCAKRRRSAVRVTP